MHTNARGLRVGSLVTGATLVATLAAVPPIAHAAPSAVAGSRAAPPTCLGHAATIVGTDAGEVLTGTAGSDVIVGYGGDDQISGRGGQDWICGGKGNDQIVGGSGRGHLGGGPGSDIIFGGKADDELLGNGGFDGLLAMGGDDRYVGGGGLDIAAFLAAPAGVAIDLDRKTARGEGTDSLSGVESAMGSDYADQILGTSGRDLMFSGRGADLLDGRGGDNDYVLLSNAPAAVEIDLGDDAYSGGGTARRVENVFGSPYSDTIYGDATLNYLDGGGGNDAVDGINGTDACLAETAFNCVPTPTDITEPDPGDGTPPEPDVAARAASAPSTTSKEHAAKVMARRSAAVARANRAVPRVSGPPSRADAEATLQKTVAQLRPFHTDLSPSRPPAPPAAVGATSGTRQRVAAASMICPMYENLARVTINIGGMVRVATANDLDPVWRWTDYIYLTGNSYWFYNTPTQTWRGPYNRVESWGVQNYQVTGPVYQGVRAYALIYSYDIGQYYDVDSCVGSYGIPGIGI